MIDTIVLNSPSIDEKLAFMIESVSIQRSGIDFSVGEILYRFTTKELKGSFDSSIRLSIKREKFVSIRDPNLKKNILEKRACKPFLEIECSLHKFFLGHNIYGGSNNILFQVEKLIDFINLEFNILLPSFLDFTIRRIDFAKIYNLGDNINNFFQGFSQVYYPRRICHKYGNTGLYFPGFYTTLKLYNKHEEFKKNDRKRLRYFLKACQIKNLEEKSKGLLRIELEVKAKKLTDIYGKLPSVSEVDIIDLSSQFNVELKRIFKMGEDSMRLYNNSCDVEEILIKNYGQTGLLYLGTWYRLGIQGYDNVKNTMPKSTFYRHINKLRDANVSWNHTDIISKDNNIVEFVFNPFNTNLELQEDLIYKVS